MGRSDGLRSWRSLPCLVLVRHQVIPRSHQHRRYQKAYVAHADPFEDAGGAEEIEAYRKGTAENYQHPKRPGHNRGHDPQKSRRDNE